MVSHYDVHQLLSTIIYFPLEVVVTFFVRQVWSVTPKLLRALKYHTNYLLDEYIFVFTVMLKHEIVKYNGLVSSLVEAEWRIYESVN